MRLSQVSALVLYTALSVTANSETILSDADVAAFPSLGFGVALQNTDLWRRSASSRSCKVFPGDKDWPSSKLWRKLDAITEGALDRPDPIGSVCFPGDTYSASECATVTAEWSDSVLQWVLEMSANDVVDR